MLRMLVFFPCMLLLAFYPIQEKVIICGVCRDVEKKLPYTMAIMEKIGQMFSDYRILVCENDSTDKTVSILKKWSKNNPKVWIQSEQLSLPMQKTLFINLLESKKYYRPELIARARNIILDKAFSSEYQDFSYLIWMDMDFTFSPSFEGIQEVFASPKEWDAVLAYGIDPQGTYWDWYAFRDANYPIGSELLGNDWWYMPKHFQLTARDDWYPVYAAFGGCGIYKKKSIEGCRYSAIVTKDLEEVAREIIEKGKASSHPQILKYLQMNQNLKTFYTILSLKKDLPKITDPHTGILLFEGKDPLIWRMSSFVYQYPSVCEHVPFHASMIKNGHGKLFINPRFIFRYGG